MPRRKQLNVVIEKIVLVTQTEEGESIENSLIEDYEKLSKKCDNVITKIKSRKKKASTTVEGK